MNPIWSTDGTGSRIFGSDVAARATNAKRTNQDKLESIRQRKQQQQLSNKQRQRLKRAEKKLQRDERKKKERDEEEGEQDNINATPIVADLQALSI